MEIVTWRLAHLGQGRNETLNKEPGEETGLKLDEIPGHKLHLNKALQPQYLENIECIPSASSFQDINPLPDQEKQSIDTEIIQQHGYMEIKHDTGKKEPMSFNLVTKDGTIELKESDTITQELMFLKTFVERVFQTETIET